MEILTQVLGQLKGSTLSVEDEGIKWSIWYFEICLGADFGGYLLKLKKL